MEWNNYLELDHNPNSCNKYLLNMNENLDLNYPYLNENNNFNFFKKYIPNIKIDNLQEENNNKIDYYNIMNNPVSEIYNLDENSDISPINYEDCEEKKKEPRK